MRVVHCKREPYTLYIGRPGPFGNPFSISSKHSRDDVVRDYEVWARKLPWYLKQIAEIPEEAVLGCYCAPLPCHGDVIVKLWKELHAEAIKD